MSHIRDDATAARSPGVKTRENKRSPTATDHAVGTRIRSVRRASGMTLRDIGDAVGVSFVQFQRYETGATRVSASRLLAISDVLGVPVGALMTNPVSSASEPAFRQRNIESAKLVRAFEDIAEPRHRLAIIAFALAVASSEEELSRATDAIENPKD